jgi:hypothetical protein
MTTIIIDIETVPSQQPGALDAIRANIKPPATLKKPESIAAWWTTEADTAVAEAHRKQSLDGGLAGEIISIAILAPDLEGDAGFVRCRAIGEPEAVLLDDFTAAVMQRIDRTACTLAEGRHAAQDPFFVGHNAGGFDLPFVWRRCVVNGVRLPFRFPRPSAREGKDFACTMVQWAGYGGRVSLDALCRSLGIASPKDGIDGAGVYDAWLAGEHERIAQYNLRDVLATAQVWHRLQGGAA